MSMFRQIISFRPIRWLAAIAWTILLSILLLQPEADPVISLGLPTGPQTLAREAFFTALHMMAFALTCALWYWTWQGHLAFGASLALGIVFAFVLGAATEFLQSFAPDRYPSLLDFIANLFGAILAARLIWQQQIGQMESDVRQPRNL